VVRDFPAVGAGFSRHVLFYRNWWAYGIARKYGDGRALAEKAGVNYQTIKQYGSVARAFELCMRVHNLTFDHHRAVTRLGSVARAFELSVRTDNLLV
jgi:hypothetical protein